MHDVAVFGTASAAQLQALIFVLKQERRKIRMAKTTLCLLHLRQEKIQKLLFVLWLKMQALALHGLRLLLL